MKRKGFSLVEIIVVIGIIGILSTMGFTSYQNIQVSSRNAKRRADLKELKTALQTFYTENGSYPNTSNAWWGHCSGFGSHDITGATGYIPNLAPRFVDVLPLDPRDGQANIGTCPAADSCYLYLSEGQNYKILAHCTPEGANTFVATDLFFDPTRTTWAWQVSSSETSRTW